jgi:hypothetical protein
MTCGKPASDEIGRRLLGTSAEAAPWLTIPNAIIELDALLPEVDPASYKRLSAYRLHLTERQAKLLAS